MASRCVAASTSSSRCILSLTAAFSFSRAFIATFWAHSIAEAATTTTSSSFCSALGTCANSIEKEDEEVEEDEEDEEDEEEEEEEEEEGGNKYAKTYGTQRARSGWAVGEALFARYKGEWYAVKVIEVRVNVIYVRFDIDDYEAPYNADSEDIRVSNV